MNGRHFPEIHLHNGSLKLISGNAICVQLTLQAADTGEDIWGSVKGQGVATGRQSRWIRKEELRKQISGEEWDGMMHMELWEDADTTDGPSALFMTKKMT